MLPTQDLLDSLAPFAVLTDEGGRILRVGEKLTQLGGAGSALARGVMFGPHGVPEPFEVTRARDAKDRFVTALNLGIGHRMLEWRASVLPGGVLYLGLDVTRDRQSWCELKALAKTAAEASESKMRFLATMSHEMRTPLNGILGMTGLLLDTGLDANQTAYAEAVRESGSALLALINDILDYSKVEAGKLDLDDHPFDLTSLVQSVTELLSPRAAHKGLEIACYVAPDVPTRLRGDEARLRQVLLNLAGNGVKFTEEGGVSIEVTLAPGHAEPVLRFDVRDTGIGIAPAAQGRIFEEFAQADDSRARSHEGTGLGLAIVRRIVRVMGGEVELSSKPGAGSVFSFELPVRVEAPNPAPIEVPRGAVVVATQSRVLRRGLGLQLAALTSDPVVFAETPDEALAALKQHRGATLLCDLPLAAAAGQRLARAAGHALVLLSPLARGRLEAFKRQGFSGYLIKPIRQTSLAERLSMREATERPTERLDAPTPKVTPSGRKLRVLLAEDNQINAVLATAIIKRSGHHVDVAGNGQEALETLAQAPYDVVLMDMHMPVMDGLEATRRIRALPSEDALVPIVALTANAMRADRETCLGAGMDDFLSKPFDPADLVAKMEHWADKEGGQQAVA